MGKEINTLVDVSNLRKLVQADIMGKFMWGTELRDTERNNRNLILDTAKRVGIRYIYISHVELVTSGNEYRHGWPAVWHVAKKIDQGRCGNRGQHQVYLRNFISFEDVGYYNTDTKKKLFKIPKKIYQNCVCTRYIKY